METSGREAEAEEDQMVQWTKKVVVTEVEVAEEEATEKEAAETSVGEEADQMREAEAEEATLREAEEEVASTTREAVTETTTEEEEMKNRVDMRSREELVVVTQTNKKTMNELILNTNQPLVKVIHCYLFKNLNLLFK